MRKPNSLMAGILFAFALFIICNCAGYLIITLFDQGRTDSPPAADTQALAPGDVVAYASPTATVPAPAGVVPSPIPLLPTVTAGPSAIATATSPPLATATPIPTGPPTATIAPIEPSQLTVISHKSYVDSLGWYHIVGEVQNNAEVPVEFVEVMAKLYDDTNTVIGTKITFTAPDTIFPGSSAPFDIITLRRSQWERIKEYRLQVKGDPAEPLLQQNLVILSQSSRLQDEYLYIEGEVKNTGDTSALAKLIITLYDADRNVIDTGWSYADAGVISAQESSAFQLKIGQPADPNNFHFRIQIEEEAIETE